MAVSLYIVNKICTVFHIRHCFRVCERSYSKEIRVGEPNILCCLRLLGYILSIHDSQLHVLKQFLWVVGWNKFLPELMTHFFTYNGVRQCGPCKKLIYFVFICIYEFVLVCFRAVFSHNTYIHTYIHFISTRKNHQYKDKIHKFKYIQC